MSYAAKDTGLVFPFEDSGCFGCSPSNPDGLKLPFRREGDEIVATYTIEDRFHGAPGVAHGGIVASILDEFSCAAAVFVLGKRVVTGEIRVRFEAACPVESPLGIRARIASDKHPKYLVIEGEVHAAGHILARSTGKFFPREAEQPAP